MNKPPYEGNFKIYRSSNSSSWDLIYEDHNLIVNKAREILRDLMFGDSNNLISSIQFGDMNLGETDDIKNVPEASLNDTGLIHKLYEKDVTKRKVTVEQSPGIEYTCILGLDELNGDGSQLLTEYGLFTEGGEMFAKKNRAGIFKDSDSSLKFVWTIIFN